MMKINEQFILRKIADEVLLIPTGDAAMNVKGLIALSQSGKELFEKLKAGAEKQDLIDYLMAEYDVMADTAQEDVESFLKQMKALDILEEE